MPSFGGTKMPLHVCTSIFGRLFMLMSVFFTVLRQQQIEAKEGQRPQIRSRDEWAATLPTAWRQHVWSEKGTQLKE